MRPALSDYRHLASGKVRELYRIDDEHLLFVATDRISAYDYILDSEIPDKGRILTAMSVFFFDYVEAPNHLAGPPDDPRIPDEVLGRALVVRELEMLPVECVARGYLTGSGLLDYQKTGKVSGIALPPGLTEASKFSPAAVHPGHQGRTGTTRREHLVLRRHRPGRRRARQPVARSHPADLHPGRRPRPDEGNHHRRHQIRVRRRRSRQPGAGRRDLHARLVAVLARRQLSRGCRPSPATTSSSSAIGLPARTRAGTATATSRHRPCHPTSSMRPAPAISKPTNASRDCSSPTGSVRQRDREPADREARRAPPRVSRRRLHRPLRVAARQVRPRSARPPGSGERLHRTGHVDSWRRCGRRSSTRSRPAPRRPTCRCRPAAATGGTTAAASKASSTASNAVAR